MLRNAGWEREQISARSRALRMAIFRYRFRAGSVRQHARSIHVHPDVLTLYRSADRPRQPRVRLDQPCDSRQRRARVSGTGLDDVDSLVARIHHRRVSGVPRHGVADWARNQCGRDQARIISATPVYVSHLVPCLRSPDGRCDDDDLQLPWRRVDCSIPVEMRNGGSRLPARDSVSSCVSSAGTSTRSPRERHGQPSLGGSYDHGRGSGGRSGVRGGRLSGDAAGIPPGRQADRRLRRPTAGGCHVP